MRISSFFIILLSSFLLTSVCLTEAAHAYPQRRVSKSVKKGTAGKPQTSEEARKQAEETQKDIRQTESQIKENEKSVRIGLNELSKLESEIEVSRRNIKQSSDLLAKVSEEIKGLETEISDNESEISRMREQYLKAVKRMRSVSRNRSALAFVFSSDNFNQALRRFRYLKQFSKWRERQSDKIMERTGELQKNRERLLMSHKEYEATLQKQRAEDHRLSEQCDRQNALVAELRKNGKALKSHLSKKQAEANELRGRIAELIALEEKKRIEEEKVREAEKRKEAERLKEKEIKEKKTVEETKPSASLKKNDDKPKEMGKNTQGNRIPKASDTGFASMRGRLQNPVTGDFHITSRFGRQTMPDLPDIYFDNPGIDAETGAGSSAIAVYGGKVTGVYMLPGYHTVVIVNHGQYYTVYGNISMPAVKVGDEVKGGQRVGLLAPDEDDPAHSTIHFEVWKGREKLNPADWLR